MSLSLRSSPEIPRISDLLERLGGIPAERVRYYPLPGTATEQDLIDLDAHEDILCELIDGVLVEKPPGFAESYIAALIVTAINAFVIPRKIGIVTGASGAMRLAPGLILSPDVAFVSRTRLRDGKVPRDPIPELAPDLAIEVLSKGNTVREMDRKRRDYFDAGTRLVWIVEPVTRTVAVYLPDNLEPTILRNNQTLTGDPVLPGFALDTFELFEDLAE